MGAPRRPPPGDGNDDTVDPHEDDAVGRLASAPVVVASVLLALAVFYAGLTGKVWYDLREGYKAPARVTRLGNIPMDAMPANPGLYASLAEVYSRDLMPPDNERARELLGEAIRLAPLDSIYWLRLAEQNLLLDQREAAIAALRVSDQLDPRWPDQRLDAVRLWRILGDRERAMELGVQIARLRDLGLTEVVSSELLDNGFPTSDVLAAIDFARRPPGEMSHLISAMAKRPSVSLDELWKAVPEGSRQDNELRTELAKLAEQRGRHELLLELWKYEPDSLTTLAPGLVTKNTDLRRSPMGQTFVLGWQPPVLETDVRTTWIAPEGMAGATGKLEVDIGPYSRDQLWWSVYRLVIPADMAVDLGARVSINPGVRTVAEVRVLVDGEWFANATTSGANDRTEDLRHAIPPAARARVATIFISWRRVAETDSLTQSKLVVHSVLVRPLPRFTAPAPAGQSEAPVAAAPSVGSGS